MKMTNETYENTCKKCEWVNKVNEEKIHCPFHKCIKEDKKWKS